PLGSDCDELCYMTLGQIRELRGRLGSRVEVDLWWKPKRLSKIKSELFEATPDPDNNIPSTSTPDPDDLQERASLIKSLRGEPCTIIVNDDAITDVITPAWLYWQFGGTIYDEENLPEHELNAARDDAARRMFKGDQGRDAEFRRYCRCVVQGMLLGQNHTDCVQAYRNDADFAPSPSWQNWEPYIGTARPDPGFKIGDVVHFGWLDDDTERRCVNQREWREYQKSWYYKVSGKWWSESGMIAADTEIVFQSGERVWWQTADGGQTGTVNFDARHDDESVTVSCDERLAVVGGVPIGRIMHVSLGDLHKGEPPDAKNDNANTDVPVNVDLPEGWEVSDVRFLLEQLDKGKMILVADKYLGIPTIHDFTDVRHCGMGVMMVEQPGFQAMFDAGASMERTPTSNKGWTSLAVREGEYDYPFEDVENTLRSYCVTADAMRDLLYDADGNLRDVDEIGPDKADALLAPFMPGGPQGPDKVFRREWQYVPLDKRQGKLAARFEGDASTLREELGKNPNQKRVNCILSALTDAGWPVPPGYITATEAGASKIVKPYMDGQPTAPFEGEHVLYLKGTMRQRSWVGDVLRINGPIALTIGVEATEGTWTAQYHTHDYGPTHFMCGDKIAVQAESAEECVRQLEEFLQGFGHQIRIDLDHDESRLPADIFGEPTHILTFGNNGSQVYFEGEQYMVLNPYKDQDRQRYGSGWVWYFRSEVETDGEWQLLPDPDVEGIPSPKFRKIELGTLTKS
ncbi:MAG: DUF2958 domain-containing protein, partial [Chloroflexi bacterium]|nr:DUF2958 domain-containing protein [Chloroflexota bacterium]